MDKALQRLIKISKLTGGDSRLVLGTFGNTSVKTANGRDMYIKASGTALKDMTLKKGWRRLDIAKVQAILKDKSLLKMKTQKREACIAGDLLLAINDRLKTNIKPSIESCFHSIFGRYVIHLHPAAVLAYCCAKDGRAELAKLFKGHTLPPLWVPYANLGYSLAKMIQKLSGSYRKKYSENPSVLFLQNHGLVVSSDNMNTALKLVRQVVGRCRRRLDKPVKVPPIPASKKTVSQVKSLICQALLPVTGKDMVVKYFIDESIAGFMAKDDAARLCTPAGLAPDELAYAKGPPLWCSEHDLKNLSKKLSKLQLSGRQIPRGFLIKPLGLFVAVPHNTRNNQIFSLKEIILMYLMVRGSAVELGGIHTLSKQQRQFIIECES